MFAKTRKAAVNNLDVNNLNLENEGQKLPLVFLLYDVFYSIIKNIIKNLFYRLIHRQSFQNKIMKNFYSRSFKNLIGARKKDSVYGINPDLVKKEPKHIKKALLNLLVSIEKLIQNPKLKYSDLSLFVIDPKFLFPHKKTSLTLEGIGPTLTVSSKGLLYELLKAIDLEKHAKLIIKLQKAIKDLHSALSQQKKDIDEYKKNVLKIIRGLKDIIANNQNVSV